MAGTFVWVGGFTQWWGTSGADTNWAISGTPVGTTPGSGDIVAIKVGATVDIGVAGTTSYEGATSADDTIVSDGQTIYNSGIVRLDAAQTNTGTATWIFTGTTGIGYDLTNTGTGSAAGSILMTDNAKNHMEIGALGSGNAATLIDVDNDISGAGLIGGAYGSALVVGVDSFGKQTTVIANDTNALTIGQLTVDNDGVLEATSAAGLILDNTVIDQTRSTTYNNAPKGYSATSSLGTPIGVIQAVGAGSFVELGPNPTTVIGGKLHTANGGVIDAVAGVLVGYKTDGAGNAAPVTIDGLVNVATGGSLETYGEIDFTPGSTINVNATASLNSSIDIDASAQNSVTTLKGGGIINLADVPNNRAGVTIGDGYAALLVNQITIQGAGYVGQYQNLLAIDNQGAIDASGLNSLVVHAGTFLNAGGLLESTKTGGLNIETTVDNQNGTVAANGAGAAVNVSSWIQGGAIASSGGGIVHILNGGLDGSTYGQVNVTGAVQVDDNNNCNVQGTIDIAANASIKLASAGGNTSSLVLTGATTLAGAGAIVLGDVGSNRNIITDNGQSQTLTNQTTIEGAGLITDGVSAPLTVINKGIVDANGLNNLRLDVTTLTNTANGLMEANQTGGLTIQAGTFTNYGALSALFGNISASASTFANISGSTLTGGEWDALAGHTLAIGDAVAITTLAAGVTLAAGSKITFDGTDLSQSLTTVASGGALGLFGATFTDANMVTIASGGSLTGFGEVNAALIDNGQIQGTGALKFDQAVSGTGAVNFLQSNALEFTGPVSVAAVNFDTNVNRTALDTLTIDDPAHFTSVIGSFGAGNDAIVLKGLTVASVTLSGPNNAGISTLTARNASGATLATLSLSGDFAGLTPIVASDGSIRLTTQHASDFTGSGFSDVAFENTTGAFATWTQSGAAANGGATLGAPGPAWSVVASGDENGDGVADLFLSNATTGQIAVWSMAADAIASTYVFAGPGGSWKVVGSGDFNGDGRADLLFRDDNGDLATWDMNGAEIVGGGLIGNPGAGWTFVGAGDFNGDRKTDLLFENASGTYATWTLDDTAITGGATLGSPGAGWVYKGTGDFNGDGTSDILFQNASTGVYATWDMRDDTVSGGGAIGSPGAGWVLRGIGNYDASARSGLLFQNTTTGLYADWTLDDTAVTGGAALGSPGPAWSVQGAAPAAKQELPGTIFFQNAAGAIASWNVEGGVNSGGAVFGAAAGYTMLGVGDFNGDLEPDVLFADAAGNYAIWTTDGAHITGGGAIGNPGAGWSYVALGDFNGDGNSDILFRDAGGNYAIWDLNGAAQVGGGALGNPGAGWSFAGVGDFNGDGTSDILFANGGTFAIWDIAQNRIVGGATLGGPGGTWTLKGTADFNGDGRTDLLFEDASGDYATWDVDGAALVGGGALGNPGAQFQYAGVADILGDHQASILFYSASSNSYATWNLNDNTIAGGASLGSPGAGWTEKAFV